VSSGMQGTAQTYPVTIIMAQELIVLVVIPLKISVKLTTVSSVYFQDSRPPSYFLLFIWHKLEADWNSEETLNVNAIATIQF
jgi:hypothetical protein